MTHLEKTREVAIIGAGPAGAYLAFELLRGGLKPVLIDKAVFPRAKVCGGGLTIKTLKLLPPDLAGVLKNEIDRVKLSFGLRQSFTKSSYQPLMYTVDRSVFDAALVDRFQCAGGEYREGERLEQITAGPGDYFTLITSKSTLKAQVVVGADGARSLVAACAGLQPVEYWHLGLQVEVRQEQIRSNVFEFSRTILLDMGSIPDGYAWVFPRGNLLVIGVSALVHQGAQLKEYFSRVLTHLGLEKRRLPLTAHLIPHRVTATPIVKDRILLIGDAAGLTDSWTGEGICFALKSSQIAACQILKFFEGEAGAFSAYQTQVDWEITPELAVSYQFSKLFHYLGSLAFRCIKDYKYPWEVFCRIMRGERSFLEIKKRFRPDIFFRKLLIKSARNRPID